MFKTTAKIRKVLSNRWAHTCAYVYRDGVAIRHDESVKVSGKDITVSVTDVYPCEIRFSLQNHRVNGYTVNRVVISESAMLCSGIESLTFYFNNSSDNTKRLGIGITTMRIYAPNGTVIPVNESDMLASGATIQPGQFNGRYGGTAPNSIAAYLNEDRDEVVNWHGDKPERASIAAD